MESIFKELKSLGLYDTVEQLQREIKANKLKSDVRSKLAGDLAIPVKWLSQESSKKPFSYPKKEVDRKKILKESQVDDKFLQKVVNKMVDNGRLDEVKTKFAREDRVFKLRCFKNMERDKENLFPDVNKIYQIKTDAEDGSDSNLGNSRFGFKPSSLDGPSETSVEFEKFKNYSDLRKKDHSDEMSKSGMGNISSIPGNSGMHSFVRNVKNSDTSQDINSFENQITGTGVGVSGIHKVEQSDFVDDNGKDIIKEIEEDDEPDTYTDDDDSGFKIVEAGEHNFLDKCQEIAKKYDFPAVSVKPPDEADKIFEKERQKKYEEERAKEDITLNKKEKKKADADKKALKRALGKLEQESEPDSDESIPTNLPKWVKFVPWEDEFYPAEFNGIVYDCYNLKVVFDREKTGFEETREFPIVPNSIIAGRYQVMEYLGSAAFSKAIRVFDLHSNEEVCMKIIENNKDYFDQSIDEIKLLRYINVNWDNVDDENVIGIVDFFYHKEHLFIVTELLKDNLYEFYKYNREQESELYFTLNRLQKITKQILVALDYIHGLKLIHCDLKPENILIKSYSQTKVKVIDFGSSCFIHDHLSSYVQSRSYRAPEVILGCRYDYKIDIWSLGCIVAELFTGYVLFQNDSVQGLLARVLGIIGPIPEYMMKEGKLVSNFFTREGILYQEGSGGNSSQSVSDASHKKNDNKDSDGPIKINLLIPKKTKLKYRLKTDDAMFIDFVRSLLQVDPCRRPTAKEAMTHPWLTETTYPEDD